MAYDPKRLGSECPACHSNTLRQKVNVCVDAPADCRKLSKEGLRASTVFIDSINWGNALLYCINAVCGYILDLGSQTKMQYSPHNITMAYNDEPVTGVSPETVLAPPACPGPDCLMCSGAACNLCGAGCWNNAPAQLCEHDVMERHEDSTKEIKQ